MTYAIAKQAQSALEAACNAASQTLQAFPRDAMGLTPDAVKLSPEYRAAKAAYTSAHAQLATFNRTFLTTYKKEDAAERAARREALSIGQSHVKA